MASYPPRGTPYPPRGARILVVQKRSAIGEKGSARGTLRALGLGRPGTRAHLEDTPQLRGMLRKVAHLVEVKANEGDAPGPAGSLGQAHR